MRFLSAATRFAMTVAIAMGAAQAQSLRTEAWHPRSEGIGYNSVSEALEALKSKPGASISYTKPDLWTIVTESGGMTQWSFAPRRHYANPAVVNREVRVAADGKVSVETTALCQAEKPACGKLFEEFQQLNENIRRAVQERITQGAAK